LYKKLIALILQLHLCDFGAFASTTVSSANITYVASDLKWTQHIDAITSKAASRLHFLKQLKPSGGGHDDLVYFYVTVIRTVLE